MDCLKKIEVSIGKKRSFNSIEEKIFEDIYRPLLRESLFYRRRTGYLTLSRIKLQLKEMVKIAAKGGRAEIIVGEFTDSSIVDEIQRSKEIPTKVIDDLRKSLSEWIHGADNGTMGSLVSLAELIAIGGVEIKLALMKNSEGRFHQKVAIFEDGHGDVVVVKGSDNSTSYAVRSNDENVMIFLSWENIFDSYAADDVEYHQKIWEERHPSIVVLDAVRSINLIRDSMKDHDVLRQILEKSEKETVELPVMGIENLELLLTNYLRNNNYHVESDVPVMSATSNSYSAVACLYTSDIVDLTSIRLLTQLSLFPHQESGIQRIIRGLDTYNTFVLADSVGLGKTRTALAVAKYMLLKQMVKKVAILAPRKLHSQWEEELVLFDFAKDDIIVESRDRLERLKVNEGEHPRTLVRGADLVIIDEAHQKLLNHRNKTYQNLRLLSRDGCRAILITATPMQNTAVDIYNLLALFGNEKLGYYFKGNNPRVRSTFANDRSAIEDVWRKGFIQRTKSFIRRSNPGTTHRYPNRNIYLQSIQLSSKENTLIADIVQRVESLNLGLYDSLKYFGLRKDLTADNIENAAERRERDKIRDSSNTSTALMRILMLKHLDSSLYTFRQFLVKTSEKIASKTTEISSLKSREEIISFIESLVLDQEDLNLSYDNTILSVSETKRRDLINSFKEILRNLSDDELFESIRDLESDLTADQEGIGSIVDILDRLLVDDPQIRQLLSHIEEHSGQKIIIFSQFARTCRYVYDCILDKYGEISGLVVGNISRLEDDIDRKYSQCCYWNTDVKKRNFILGMFAPDGKEIDKRISHSKDSNEKVLLKMCRTLLDDGKSIDILVATDTLSVGQNLQDASVMINLDLPWNPMVLEQRIGRIDRPRVSGSDITIYEYILSNDSLEAQLSIIQTLENKMKGIYNLTNFDSQVLPLKPLLQLLNNKLKELDSLVSNKQSITDIMDEVEIMNEFDNSLNTKINEDEESLDRIRQYIETMGIDCDSFTYPLYSMIPYSREGIGFVGEVTFRDVNSHIVSTELLSGFYDVEENELHSGISMIEAIVKEGKTWSFRTPVPRFTEHISNFEKSISSHFQHIIEEDRRKSRESVKLAIQKNVYSELKMVLIDIYRDDQDRVKSVVGDLNRFKQILDLLEDPLSLTNEEKGLFDELSKYPDQLFSNFESYYSLLFNDKVPVDNEQTSTSEETKVKHSFNFKILFAIFCRKE